MYKSCFEFKQYLLLMDSYWFYGDLLLLIDHMDTEKYWVMNECINLKSLKSDKPIGVQFINFASYESKMQAYYSCPFLEFQKIPKSNDGLIFNKNVIKFIIDQINLNYCILLKIDRFFLNNKQKGNHQIMVYGYDDESKTIFYCDNGLTGKYRTNLKCSFAELNLAYSNFNDLYDTDFNASVFLLKPKENKKYSININYIKTSIEEYLYIRTDYINKDKKWDYGIKIYEQFIEYFYSIINNELEKKHDIRGLCVLYDHKKAMKYRLNYFTKNKLVANKKIAAEYDEIENQILQARNLLLKFYFNYDLRLIKKIIEKLKIIREKEFELLTAFVSSI